MKYLKLLAFLIASCSWHVAFCQITVTESTLKIPALGEEVFYYGFAEGDLLSFSFQELDNKELKEVEILEWPSSSKFMDYKTKSIPEKIIPIPTQGIYKFRFANSSLAARICKITIKRIPENSSKEKFNTTVYWKTTYDTLHTPVTENYLEKSDTLFQHLVDNVTKVSSQNALNGNSSKAIVDFDLPENTIAWSYYIGTGSESKEAFEKSKDELILSAAKTLSKIPEYGPMAALALYGIDTFSKIQGRDNVKFWFITDWQNAQQFMGNQSFLQYKQGDVINDAAQMKQPLTGKVYLGLFNDNVVEPIEVIVKITVVQLNQKWSTRTADQRTITPRQEPYLR